MMIIVIGLPVYFLLILAGNAWAAVTLVLKTLLIASGIGFALALIGWHQELDEAGI